MIRQEIAKKAKEIRFEDPSIGPVKLNLRIISWLFSSFNRVILAKVYLRKVNEKGKAVTVLGKPMIRNKGEIKLGDRVAIWSNTERAKILVRKKGRLTVEKGARINGVHISVTQEVFIGENVRIAPYSIILDSDFHDIKNHFSPGKSAPVVIEKNVWIGTRSMILKGVTIGEGSVVAAGSVVSKSVAPNTVVGGVPAKFIKNIE